MLGRFYGYQFSNTQPEEFKFACLVIYMGKDKDSLLPPLSLSLIYIATPMWTPAPGVMTLTNLSLSPPPSLSLSGLNPSYVQTYIV